MIIKEDYCSSEIAKLLQEKGFDEKCRASFDENCKFYIHATKEWMDNATESGIHKVTEWTDIKI